MPRGRYTRELPPVETLLQHFGYHEEEYTRSVFKCIGGLYRKGRYRHVGSRIAGGADKLGYLRTPVPGYKGLLSIHRMVWTIFNGPIPKGYVIDHINGDPSDNRVRNLRAVTDAQNQMNRKSARTDSTVKYVGVCRSGKQFNAFISSGGAPELLGRFDCAKEAAAVRDKAVAAKYSGVATLNRDLFPEDFHQLKD